jgi:ubiquitin-conjugating enzyme E2 variant
LFVWLTIWSLTRLTSEAGNLLPVVLLVTLALGWIASDLLSGFLHWALDSLGTTRTPVIGQSFIRPFREHHIDPKAMTQHDFVETHGSSCFAALPFLVAACLVRLDSPASLFLQGLLIAVALGALATNQCHKWAHMDVDAVPKWIRWAQRYHLILPPWQHQLHHTPPYNTHFCMSNGWLNGLFNFYLRLWR